MNVPHKISIKFRCIFGHHKNNPSRLLSLLGSSIYKPLNPIILNI